MSFSANYKFKKNSLYYLDRKYIDDKIIKYTKNIGKSLNKEDSRLNIFKLNKSFPSTFSNSSVNTNISVIKDKEKDKLDKNIPKIPKTVRKEKELSCNSYQFPIRPIIEDSLENIFISKQKIIYKSPKILNNKIISFQNQKSKQIFEFPLFDDKLIFKDINRSYLQDENNDDGSESSDEKINDGKLFLKSELEISAKELTQALKKNRDKKLLSRRIRFKN